MSDSQVRSGFNSNPDGDDTIINDIVCHVNEQTIKKLLIIK